MNARDDTWSSFTETPMMRSMRQNWGWYLTLGILLVLLGLFAMAFSFAATVATVVLFGIVAIAAGVLVAASAVWAGGFWGGLLRVVVGLLIVAAGIWLLVRPVSGALALTIGIAIILIITGIVQGLNALFDQGPGWGWSLTAGIVSIILGGLLWAGWPVTGYVAIGLFLGIEILVSGFSLIITAINARTWAPPPTPARPAM